MVWREGRLEKYALGVISGMRGGLGDEHVCRRRKWSLGLMSRIALWANRRGDRGTTKVMKC